MSSATQTLQIDEVPQVVLQLYQQQTFEPAEALAMQYLSVRPKDAEMHFCLGKIFWAQKKWPQSAQALNDAISIAPTKHEWLHDLGLMYFEGGAKDAARQTLETYAKRQQSSWRMPSEFIDDYFAGIRCTDTPVYPSRRLQRFHLLWEVAQKTFQHFAALKQPIHMAECGCFMGLSAFLLASVRRRVLGQYQGQAFHIFDSFEGLSAPTDEDLAITENAEQKRAIGMSKAGMFKAAQAQVEAALAEFPQIQYHAGWIPQSFEGLPEQSYGFVNVDVDLYAPTKASFEYFYPRLAVGGVIITDDYNWPGAKQAVDEFIGSLAPNSFRLETTEHHQAIIYKMAEC